MSVTTRRRLIAVILILAVIAVILALVSSAQAKAPTRQHARSYARSYRQVARQLGRRAPGCNLFGSCHVKATDAEVLDSLGVLQRMLAPAPSMRVRAYSPSVQAGVQAVTSAVSSVVSSTVGALPSCASESGTNYSTGAANTNSSSGATGRYQITPGTAANYGCSLSTPAGQDQCAQVIYQHQGSGAWVGCGG